MKIINLIKFFCIKKDKCEPTKGTKSIPNNDTLTESTQKAACSDTLSFKVVSEQTPQKTLLDLPDELLLKIFSYIEPDPITILTMAQVCKLFDRLIHDKNIQKFAVIKLLHAYTPLFQPDHLVINYAVPHIKAEQVHTCISTFDFKDTFPQLDYGHHINPLGVNVYQITDYSFNPATEASSKMHRVCLYALDVEKSVTHLCPVGKLVAFSAPITFFYNQVRRNEQMRADAAWHRILHPPERHY